MNLRTVFKFRDYNLQFYEKIVLSFQCESSHTCQSLAPLVETRTKKKKELLFKKTSRFHRERLTARSKNYRLNCIAVQFSTVNVLFSLHALLILQSLDALNKNFSGPTACNFTQKICE